MLIRPRRLRRTPLLRALARETQVQASHLMLPHFVLPGINQRQPIASMPGMERLSVELLVEQVGADLHLGIDKVLLFGIPDQGDKDARGSAAASEDGPVPRAVRALKENFGDKVLVGTDCCMCAYTDHGHCGILGPAPAGTVHVDNDATLPQLARMAVAHAKAGADLVAPSDMMDGRVAALRRTLDESGCVDTAILSYAVKYASAYYGPFRDAATSAPGMGDRRGYQMDPSNVREARREAQLDEEQGADMLMVKPALAYLDVIAAVRQQSALPLACYNVSGEYSMVKAAAERGLINEAAVVLENLTAMRRAGADLIITYHAREALAAGWL